MSDGGTMLTVPESNSVKYFVGQVPRAFDETHLKPIFEEYGPVYQLNVLRDKATNQSKGCCFVTFYKHEHGTRAQSIMHNKVTLHGMNHPVQMKPADTEKRNVDERKLFVGMLSKKQTEDDVVHMFSSFGQIEECTVLRDGNGNSRGCAFVTFASRTSAQNAIKALNESTCMEGCTSPIKVRLADTQKEKEEKRLLKAQQEQQQHLALGLVAPTLYPSTDSSAGSTGSPVAAAAAPASLTGAAGLYSPQYVQLLQNAVHQPTLSALGYGTSDSAVQGYANLGLSFPQTLGAANGTAQSTLFMPGASISPSPSVSPLQLGGYAGLSASLTGAGAATGLTPLTAATAPTLSNGVSGLVPFGGLPLHMSATGVGHSLANGTGLTNGGLVPNGTSLSGAALTEPQSPSPLPAGGATSPQDSAISQAFTGLQQYAGWSSNGLPAATDHAATPAAVAAAAQLRTQESPAGRQTEGPDGANLFIYHLPQEFTDENLAQTFAAYGKVVSAKVFIDQNTQLSKCFGFVSYDNAQSAQAAIASMNGFQIGMKRLKVQLKKAKLTRRPY